MIGLPPQGTTTLDVDVRNTTFEVVQLKLEIARIDGASHWAKDLTLQAGANVTDTVPETSGFYRWTATTPHASCRVIQDVGQGDYGWNIRINENGTIGFSFHLDDYDKSTPCGHDSLAEACKEPAYAHWNKDCSAYGAALRGNP